MTDTSLQTRYSAAIAAIVEATLKGQIRSKEQVYEQLVTELEAGTGEVFDQCLAQSVAQVEADLKSADELKAAKAMRRQRALKTIQAEWARYQTDQQSTGAIATAVQAILSAAPEERVIAWVSTVDPNHLQGLNLEEQKQLATQLQGLPTRDRSLSEIPQGIHRGLKTWQAVEPYVVQWIYEQPQSIGFSGASQASGPWQLWGASMTTPVLRSLFQALATSEDIEAVMNRQSVADSDWVELALTLQGLQRGLVSWAEKQPYDSKAGTQLCIGSFLTFAAVWGQVANGYRDRPSLQAASFQIVLQILRNFAQRPYFPLYGGVFALFWSGSSLNNLLEYLDAPLKQVENTQEKARLLTLIGYSQRVMRNLDTAISFHQQALEIAQEASDHRCAIANLNHLSRTHAVQKHYSEAIRYAQQALIQARQSGDSLGEANALANVGYSEILAARDLERFDADSSELAIAQLQQGLKLAESLGDRQSQALCSNSLGIAYVMLEQPQTAVTYLEAGAQAARQAGDMYLQGLNLAYLAEAMYALGDRTNAVIYALVSMYQLEQIQASEWRQPAGLLSIVQGQLGEEGFMQLMQQVRSQIIGAIGVDGYDHLPTLMQQYRS